MSTKQRRPNPIRHRWPEGSINLVIGEMRHAADLSGLTWIAPKTILPDFAEWVCGVRTFTVLLCVRGITQGHGRIKGEYHDSIYLDIDGANSTKQYAKAWKWLNDEVIS